MKKGCIIILGLLLVVFTAALVVVDSKYGAILPSPAVSHKTLMTPDTRIRAVLRPALAKEFIATHFLATIDVPDMALDLAMPHELALLVQTDPEAGTMDATVFLNEKRLGPEISRRVNAMKIFDKVKILTWNPEGVVYEKAGIVTAKGRGDLHQGMSDLVWRIWGDSVSRTALTVEGGHLFEATVDNRDGGATLILGSLSAIQGGDWRKLEKEANSEALASISSLRLWADLTGKDTLELYLRIECKEPPFSLRALVPFLLDLDDDKAFRTRLQKERGITMTGDGDWKDGIFEGVYTFEGITKLF